MFKDLLFKINKYSLSIKLSLFVLILMFILKVNIDSKLNHSIDEVQLLDYTNKMDLILKKVYGIPINKTNDLSFFIDSFDQNNEFLKELSLLNIEFRKDNKISLKEYKHFDDLFEYLYKIKEKNK